MARRAWVSYSDPRRATRITGAAALGEGLANACWRWVLSAAPTQFEDEGAPPSGGGLRGLASGFALVLLSLGAGAGAGGAAAYGVLQWRADAGAPLAAPPPGGEAEPPAEHAAPQGAVNIGEPGAAARLAAPPFDPAPLQDSLRALRADVADLERALRLTPGAGAGEALRRRLTALEAAPKPAEPDQLQRAVNGVSERLRIVEGVVGAREETAAGLQRRLGDLAARLARLEAAAARYAPIEALAATQAELAALQSRVAIAETAAASAGRAARAAFALSALAEAAEGEAPFGAAYAALAAALPDDPDVAALADLSRTGAPGLPRLRTRFAALEPALQKALLRQAAGGGILGEMQAAIAGQVSVRRLDAADAPQAQLEQAAAALARGDLAGGLGIVSRWQGEPAKIAADWRDAARRRMDLESRLARIRARLAEG